MGDGITLSINDYGISCKLSKYLPQYIAKNMGGYVDSFLGKHDLEKSDIDFWAVHPGGRRIIEEAQNGLGLTEEQCKYSWEGLTSTATCFPPRSCSCSSLSLRSTTRSLARARRDSPRVLLSPSPPASVLRASSSRCSSKCTATAKV